MSVNDDKDTKKKKDDKTAKRNVSMMVLQKSPKPQMCTCTIAGDVAVGKTSFVRRIIANEFLDAYRPTIAGDYKSYTYRDITFGFWDSAGDAKFHSAIPAIYRMSNVIILLYDLNDLNTYYNIDKYWIPFLKKFGFTNQNFIRIGNKRDLVYNFESITIYETKQKEINPDFLETSLYISAKTGENISGIMGFLELVYFKAYTNNLVRALESPDTVELYDPFEDVEIEDQVTHVTSKGCCKVQ